jgi:ATP-dependent Clp protease ATP-binding subunit ClpA
VVDDALGGILFIDEAYSITSDGSSFGKECVDALVKRLEDDQGKFICIAAGYTKEMNEFIDTNPGLKSRFTMWINFPDYTPDELAEIFRKMVKVLNINSMQKQMNGLGIFQECSCRQG